METQSVSERLDINSILMWLTTQEDFIVIGYGGLSLVSTCSLHEVHQMLVCSKSFPTKIRHAFRIFPIFGYFISLSKQYYVAVYCCLLLPCYVTL